jgi:hypothetical protein
MSMPISLTHFLCKQILSSIFNEYYIWQFSIEYLFYRYVCLMIFVCLLGIATIATTRPMYLSVNIEGPRREGEGYVLSFNYTLKSSPFEGCHPL